MASINAHELPANVFSTRKSAVLFAFALANVFQAGKDNSLVGGAAGKAESRHGEHAFHVMVCAYDGGGAVHDFSGVLQ